MNKTTSSAHSEQSFTGGVFQAQGMRLSWGPWGGEVHTEETADMSRCARNSHLIEKVEYLGSSVYNAGPLVLWADIGDGSQVLHCLLGPGVEAWDGLEKLQTCFQVPVPPSCGLGFDSDLGGTPTFCWSHA